MSTDKIFRYCKTLLVAFIAIMSWIIVIGNVTDYYTNYHFVEHVFKMDTTFPDSHVHYRSIDNEFIYHLGYILIILSEGIMGWFCLSGSIAMYRQLKNAAGFHQSKSKAVIGIMIGIAVWFFGFEVIGGEWFAMWQSSTWNGLASAERIVSFLVLSMILLQMKEEE